MIFDCAEFVVFCTYKQPQEEECTTSFSYFRDLEEWMLLTELCCE